MNLSYRSLSLAGPRGHNQDCILEPTTSGVRIGGARSRTVLEVPEAEEWRHRCVLKL